MRRVSTTKNRYRKPNTDRPVGYRPAGEPRIQSGERKSISPHKAPREIAKSKIHSGSWCIIETPTDEFTLCWEDKTEVKHNTLTYVVSNNEIEDICPKCLTMV
jgi:hypothetical protein